ncbi:hypothetical protein DFH09DRAFT_1190348 [Mycena vulgaris]|nr:hypothetical protein DFH09DRAFT_1190348 [Mycena vulgaris]
MAVPSFTFNPHNTLGALQIGVHVSYFLFGVTTTQAYIYYGRFPNDSIKIKLLVVFIWLCELAQAICIGHVLYTETIVDYGQPARLLLDRVPPSLALAALFSGIIGATVQVFFSLRIYRLSKSIYFPIFCWILSFLRLLGIIVIAVFGAGVVTLPAYEARWGWLLNAVWAINVANEWAIAVALVYLLSRERGRAHQSTTALVDKVIGWTIETGLVTSATSILTLACFVTMKNNYIWLAWYVITARVFANSLLASLNSRTVLRAMNESRLQSSLPTHSARPIDIEMTKITHITHDFKS